MLIRASNYKDEVRVMGKEDRARRLTLWQRSSGLNWKEVAAKCGYKTSSYISQMMSGVRPFSEDVARHMETSLGMTRGYLDGDQGRDAVPPLFSEVATYITILFAGTRVTRDQARRLLDIAYQDCVAKGRLDEQHVKALVDLIAL